MQLELDFGMSMVELQTDLRNDEGLKLFVYDDYDGKPIVPGKLVRGHPTVGIGRALDTHGITEEEALYLEGHDIEEATAKLVAALPWVTNLAPVRCEVLVEMTFNMGIGGLLKFKNTLADVQAGNYAKAAVEMLDSLWAKQVGKRANRLSERMRTGVHE